MKKFTITSMVLLLFALGLHAQSVGIKTNAAHWAMMATPNIGIEMSLNRKYTLDVEAGYNPFTFNDNKKFKHWIVMPELRYWTCESFNGHFFGVHALASEFNVGGIDIPIG